MPPHRKNKWGGRGHPLCIPHRLDGLSVPHCIPPGSAIPYYAPPACWVPPRQCTRRELPYDEEDFYNRPCNIDSRDMEDCNDVVCSSRRPVRVQDERYYAPVQERTYPITQNENDDSSVERLRVVIRQQYRNLPPYGYPSTEYSENADRCQSVMQRYQDTDVCPSMMWNIQNNDICPSMMRNSRNDGPGQTNPNMVVTNRSSDVCPSIIGSYQNLGVCPSMIPPDDPGMLGNNRNSSKFPSVIGSSQNSDRYSNITGINQNNCDTHSNMLGNNHNSYQGLSKNNNDYIPEFPEIVTNNSSYSSSPASPDANVFQNESLNPNSSTQIFRPDAIYSIGKPQPSNNISDNNRRARSEASETLSSDVNQNSSIGKRYPLSGENKNTLSFRNKYQSPIMLDKSKEPGGKEPPLINQSQHPITRIAIQNDHQEMDSFYDIPGSVQYSNNRIVPKAFLNEGVDPYAPVHLNSIKQDGTGATGPNIASSFTGKGYEFTCANDSSRRPPRRVSFSQENQPNVWNFPRLDCCITPEERTILLNQAQGPLNGNRFESNRHEGMTTKCECSVSTSSLRKGKRNGQKDQETICDCLTTDKANQSTDGKNKKTADHSCECSLDTEVSQIDKTSIAYPDFVKNKVDENSKYPSGELERGKKANVGLSSPKSRPKCTCHYPPAFKDFSCMGNVSGNCDCSDS